MMVLKNLEAGHVLVKSDRGLLSNSVRRRKLIGSLAVSRWSFVSAARENVDRGLVGVK
jgi:hypothetical protein